MEKQWAIVNGVRRRVIIAEEYDQTVFVVSRGKVDGPNEIGMPVITGTKIKLPHGGVYKPGELEVRLNNHTLEDIFDYNIPPGSGYKDSIQLTFDLKPNDRLRFIVKKSD